MSRGSLYGVACKTCRRRGRKCDRRLPKCANCGLRGAECEGYPVRWIDGARKPARNNRGRAHDTNSHGPLRSGSRIAAPITIEGSHQRSQRLPNMAQEGPASSLSRKNEADRSDGHLGLEDNPFQVRSERRQSQHSLWKPLVPKDDLDSLVTYCMALRLFKRC